MRGTCGRFAIAPTDALRVAFGASLALSASTPSANCSSSQISIRKREFFFLHVCE